MNGPHPTIFDQLKKVDALIDRGEGPAMVEERLPFTVRVARTEEDLKKAIGIRYAAYARHMPEFANSLKAPEEDDTEYDNVVLLAESKLDDSVLGTVRIQSNQFRPLRLEQSVQLPSWLQNSALAEVRRLAIVSGTQGRLAKMILIKACFHFCEYNEVEWAVLAARHPLNKGYEQLLFRDILNGETFVPQPVANNVPHHVMAFDVENTRQRLTEAKHPLLNFFCNTTHPDIDLGIHARPRKTVRFSFSPQQSETTSVTIGI